MKKGNFVDIREKIFNDFSSVMNDNAETNWESFWLSFGKRIGNPYTNKAYSGRNVLSCAIDMIVNGYEKPYYITFNQAKEIAAKQIEGYVIKEINGQKKVVWEGDKKDQPFLIDRSDLSKKATTIFYWIFKEKEVENENGELEIERKVSIKTYRVYNVELFKNIDIPLPEKDFVPNDFQTDQSIIDFFVNMNNGPKFQESLYYDPSYNKKTDIIQMPTIGQFDSFQEYIGTLSHEYTHATGHPSRLNRSSLVNAKGINDKIEYPKDELVAELAANMFAAQFGFFDEISENSKAYVAGWIRRLNDFDTNKKKHFVWAINKAYEAFNYIVDNQPTNELTAA